MFKTSLPRQRIKTWARNQHRNSLLMNSGTIQEVLYMALATGVLEIKCSRGEVGDLNHSQAFVSQDIHCSMLDFLFAISPHGNNYRNSNTLLYGCSSHVQTAFSRDPYNLNKTMVNIPI